MASSNVVSASSTSRGKQLEEIRATIRDLAEERDLKSIAEIAGMSIRELRMLCERPVTCAELGNMLDELERLNLDDWEISQE